MFQNTLFFMTTTFFRHTNLYAAIQDITVIKRTHEDWPGVISSGVTFEKLAVVFPEVDLEESQNDDNESNAPPSDHQHATRYQRDRREISAEETAYKFEKMAILKSRFFEALNVLEAATAREDVDNFFTIIDDGVFAIKGKLPALPARTVTTRAKRPSGERKAKPRPLKQKQQKKEGAAPKSMQRRARAASGDSSDAESVTGYGFHYFAGSSSSDSQTSIPDDCTF
jgi:hypothetical protein